MNPRTPSQPHPEVESRIPEQGKLFLTVGKRKILFPAALASIVDKMAGDKKVKEKSKEEPKIEEVEESKEIKEEQTEKQLVGAVKDEKGVEVFFNNLIIKEPTPEGGQDYQVEERDDGGYSIYKIVPKEPAEKETEAKTPDQPGQEAPKTYSPTGSRQKPVTYQIPVRRGQKPASQQIPVKIGTEPTPAAAQPEAVKPTTPEASVLLQESVFEIFTQRAQAEGYSVEISQQYALKATILYRDLGTTLTSLSAEELTKFEEELTAILTELEISLQRGPTPEAAPTPEVPPFKGDRLYMKGDLIEGLDQSQAYDISFKTGTPTQVTVPSPGDATSPTDYEPSRTREQLRVDFDEPSFKIRVEREGDTLQLSIPDREALTPEQQQVFDLVKQTVTEQLQKDPSNQILQALQGLMAGQQRVSIPAQETSIISFEEALGGQKVEDESGQDRTPLYFEQFGELPGSEEVVSRLKTELRQPQPPTPEPVPAAVEEREAPLPEADREKAGRTARGTIEDILQAEQSAERARQAARGSIEDIISAEREGTIEIELDRERLEEMLTVYLTEMEGLAEELAEKLARDLADLFDSLETSITDMTDEQQGTVEKIITTLIDEHTEGDATFDDERRRRLTENIFNFTTAAEQESQDDAEAQRARARTAVRFTEGDLAPLPEDESGRTPSQLAQEIIEEGHTPQTGIRGLIGAISRTWKKSGGLKGLLGAAGASLGAMAAFKGGAVLIGATFGAPAVVPVLGVATVILGGITVAKTINRANEMRKRGQLDFSKPATWIGLVGGGAAAGGKLAFGATGPAGVALYLATEFGLNLGAEMAMNKAQTDILKNAQEYMRQYEYTVGELERTGFVEAQTKGEKTVNLQELMDRANFQEDPNHPHRHIYARRGAIALLRYMDANPDVDVDLDFEINGINLQNIRAEDLTREYLEGIEPAHLDRLSDALDQFNQDMIANGWDQQPNFVENYSRHIFEDFVKAEGVDLIAAVEKASRMQLDIVQGAMGFRLGNMFVNGAIMAVAGAANVWQYYEQTGGAAQIDQNKLRQDIKDSDADFEVKDVNGHKVIMADVDGDGHNDLIIDGQGNTVAINDTGIIHKAALDRGLNPADPQLKIEYKPTPVAGANVNHVLGVLTNEVGGAKNVIGLAVQAPNAPAGQMAFLDTSELLQGLDFQDANGNHLPIIDWEFTVDANGELVIEIDPINDGKFNPVAEYHYYTDTLVDLTGGGGGGVPPMNTIATVTKFGTDKLPSTLGNIDVGGTTWGNLFGVGAENTQPFVDDGTITEAQRDQLVVDWINASDAANEVRRDAVDFLKVGQRDLAQTHPTFVTEMSNWLQQQGPGGGGFAITNTLSPEGIAADVNLDEIGAPRDLNWNDIIALVGAGVAAFAGPGDKRIDMETKWGIEGGPTGAYSAAFPKGQPTTAAQQDDTTQAGDGTDEDRGEGGEAAGDGTQTTPPTTDSNQTGPQAEQGPVRRAFSNLQNKIRGRRAGTPPTDQAKPTQTGQAGAAEQTGPTTQTDSLAPGVSQETETTIQVGEDTEPTTRTGTAAGGHLFGLGTGRAPVEPSRQAEPSRAGGVATGLRGRELHIDTETEGAQFGAQFIELEVGQGANALHLTIANIISPELTAALQEVIKEMGGRVEEEPPIPPTPTPEPSEGPLRVDIEPQVEVEPQDDQLEEELPAGGLGEGVSKEEEGTPDTDVQRLARVRKYLPRIGARELSESNKPLSELTKEYPDRGIVEIQPKDAQRGTILGREPHPDLIEASALPISTDDPTVSREHAYVFWDEGDWVNKDKELTITDLGSTNGTFVNGTRLTPGQSQALAQGDRISFGNTNYQVTGIGPGGLLVLRQIQQPAPSRLKKKVS